MKYTLQEAREILGVTETANRDEIERKYDVMLRKYRQLKNNEELDQKAEADYVRSTEAYRIVMGFEVDEPVIESKETYSDKVFKKAGIDKKKADNFLHYHKYHILVSIAALVIIILIVRSFVLKVEPDVSIGFMGQVNPMAYDTFENKIKEKVPEIKEVAIDSATLSQDSPDDFANLQKALVLIVASDVDMFLVNKYAYDKYAPDGTFMALEDIAKELNIDVSKSEYLKLKVVDEWNYTTKENEKKTPKTFRDSEPILYGIDVTNSEFFKGMDIIGPEKILVIKLHPENRDLMLKLVKLFTGK